MIMHAIQPTAEDHCRTTASGVWHQEVDARHMAPVEGLACQAFMRRGYTLLELMIALGLLGALMAVAWSLMATFQDAEQRGWKLTQRTQIIRAAHDWLQSDAQQVITQSPEMNFTGSSLGFTTLIAPSLDPLPFLERLMSDSNAGDEIEAGGPATVNASGNASGLAGSLPDSEVSEILGDDSPWNKARLEIEYQLLPMPTADPTLSATGQATAGDPSADDAQFMLVRREMVSDTSLALSGSLVEDSQAIPASERVLTGQDLYRQTDEEQIVSSGIAIAESRLEGLVRPQFQYSDGRSWSSSWNSRSAGRLPVAVALRFDFPPRSQMQPRPPRSSSDSLDADSDLALTDSVPMTAADMALAGEAQAELQTDADASLMESEEFEVQMIVLFYRQPMAVAGVQSGMESAFGDGAIDASSVSSAGFDYDAEFPLGDPAASMPADVSPRPGSPFAGGQSSQSTGNTSGSGTSGSGTSGSRQTEQSNREQRDGF